MEKYARGSEWRRWDLHVHTPETKKNDQYTGTSPEEKWDNFYNAINEYIGDGSDPMKNIAVIGITDYLSIDNYQNVIKDARLPQSVKLVLPNVEMRLSSMAKNSPVNIHCIFNPSIADELNERFFSKLEFDDGERIFSATKEGLIALGKKVEIATDDAQAHKTGVKKFLIDIKNLRKIFDDDKELRENTIIVVPNAGLDGASGITENDAQNDTLRKSIYKLADMIFSGKTADIIYFLGQKNNNPIEKVIHDCGSLKPCIHGCDAHKLEDLFEPVLQRYCWIKADPTFNGLKQVIYEPEARVRVSSTIPETKSRYQVIESVVVKNDLFPSEKIVFNDKLNCIIGGKSTGKSLLLSGLAMSIDKQQSIQKLEKTGIVYKPLNGVLVNWVDGTKSSSDNIKALDDKHKILYIPQTYLNRLSDDKDGKNEIDYIIENVLSQNMGFTKLKKSIQEELKKNKIYLSKCIYDLISKYNTLVDVQSKLLEKGSIDQILGEIKRLKSQIDKLPSNLFLTSDEINEYDTKNRKFNDNKKSIEQISDMEDSLDSIHDIVVKNELPYFLDKDINTIIIDIQKQAIKKSKEFWIKKKEEIKSKLEKSKTELKSENETLEKYLIQISAKMDKNEAFSIINKKIEQQNLLAMEYTSLNEELDRVKNEYNILKQNIISKMLNNKSVHDKYSKFDFSTFDTDDLAFSVETELKVEALKDFIKKKLDNRFLKGNRQNIGVDIDLLNDKMFDEAFLEKFIDLCLSNEMHLTKNCTKEDFLLNFFQDWYESRYRIFMDDDSIKDMSPGKKAIVLLKLLIQLTDSKCPVLIDQPEDDLDNRSIYKDLILFIKKKKIDRQFIVVTHNANIVVGGDAEEVIVANRDGTKTPNEKYKFEYLTGSIENDEAIDEKSEYVLPQKSIQGHICEIMEGGQEAFNLRKHKYNMR